MSHSTKRVEKIERVAYKISEKQYEDADKWLKEIIPEVYTANRYPTPALLLFLGGYELAIEEKTDLSFYERVNLDYVLEGKALTVKTGMSDIRMEFIKERLHNVYPTVSKEDEVNVIAYLGFVYVNRVIHRQVWYFPSFEEIIKTIDGRLEPKIKLVKN